MKSKEERKRRLRAGTIKRLHVHQAIIKRNIREGRDEAAMTVQTSAGSLQGHELVGYCPHCNREAFKLLQRMDKPLSCGARVWVETTARIEVVIRDKRVVDDCLFPPESGLCPKEKIA